MFKKILCADDLSRRAIKVLKAALDITLTYNCELTILNVREDFLDKSERIMLRVDLSDFKDDMTRKALAVREHIEQDIQNWGYEGVNFRIFVREGKPSKEIIAVANEIDADLIVIGLFGSSMLKDRLLGSIAEHLCAHAKRTVLTVWNGE